MNTMEFYRGFKDGADLTKIEEAITRFDQFTAGLTREERSSFVRCSYDVAFKMGQNWRSLAVFRSFTE